MIVFISSPYSGDVEKNVEATRKYCRYAVYKGHIPIATHLLFPQFLDEATVRTLGFRMGFRLLDRCDELWAFVGERSEPLISSDMALEIAYAEEHLIPVRHIKI